MINPTEPLAACSRRSGIRAALAALVAAPALLLAGTLAAERPAQPREGRSALPLLPPGLVIGTTRFGSGDLPPAGDPVTRRIDDAVAAGLRGFTVYADWPALEPAPGEYALEPLLIQLDRLHARGLATYVNITVGDIGEYVVPPEYADGAGGLAEGVRLDDPAVIARFGALLTALAPALVERGVFALGVGNEVDDRLDGEHPGERAPYAAFVAAANARLETIAPELDVGITLTSQPHLTGSETLVAMRAAADFVAVNYAPIAPDFFVLPPSEIAADLGSVLDTFGRGPVLVQELTCPSAVSMNASDAWQAMCFEILFDELAADPRIRFASVFSLEDFDGALCAQVRAAFLPFGDVPQDFADRFLDYLCELGVLEPGGEPKPAWDVLLRAVENSPHGRLQRLRDRSEQPGNRADLLRRGVQNTSIRRR